MTGLQDAGVLATLKHWPGHGSTSTDRPAQVAVIDESALTWRTHDSAPIAAGIMVGHLALPALDPRGQAATFSPRWWATCSEASWAARVWSSPTRGGWNPPAPRDRLAR